MELIISELFIFVSALLQRSSFLALRINLTHLAPSHHRLRVCVVNVPRASGHRLTSAMRAGKLEQLRSVVHEVNCQFQDPDKTTFVCVCIPEFLSLYETERLVQELAKFDMDCHNIVINQVLYPEEGHGSKLLNARVKMQQKYLDQFHELYEDFHLVKCVPDIRHLTETLQLRCGGIPFCCMSCALAGVSLLGIASRISEPMTPAVVSDGYRHRKHGTTRRTHHCTAWMECRGCA